MIIEEKQNLQTILGNFASPDNVYPLSTEDQAIADAFHKMYFRLLEKKSGLQISWLGYQTGKVPADLWMYQELLTELKPDIIIECGTHWGGSALFLANMCELIGKGNVITVDLYPKPILPKHDLLEYIHGSSIDPSIVKRIKSKVAHAKNILVILDSNHTKDHVLAELKAYSDLIPINGYLIVEDTFLNGHPSHIEFGEGPAEAVEIFMRENSDFVIDKSREKFLFTLNRNGFLRRVK